MASPLILAGMHRSGTSMVTRLLDQAGLFVGKRLEGNHEAVFFLRLNQWALRTAGATWDDPLAVRYLYAHDQGRAVVRDYFERSLSGPRATAFFGPRRSRVEAGAWGWKDPRNTALLPLWLDIFPEARVLIVDRHGVDVAESLRARFRKTWPVRRARYERYAQSYRVRPSRHPVTSGFRVSDLGGAFGVWEAYQGLADEHTAGLGERVLRFHYEDLLADPQPWLERIFAFAHLDVARGQVESIAQGINASRAFAYRKEPELAAFAKTRKRQLAAYGYAP